MFFPPLPPPSLNLGAGNSPETPEAKERHERIASENAEWAPKDAQARQVKQEKRAAKAEEKAKALSEKAAGRAAYVENGSRSAFKASTERRIFNGLLATVLMPILYPLAIIIFAPAVGYLFVKGREERATALKQKESRQQETFAEKNAKTLNEKRFDRLYSLYSTLTSSLNKRWNTQFPKKMELSDEQREQIENKILPEAVRNDRAAAHLIDYKTPARIPEPAPTNRILFALKVIAATIVGFFATIVLAPIAIIAFASDTDLPFTQNKKAKTTQDSYDKISRRLGASTNIFPDTALSTAKKVVVCLDGVSEHSIEAASHPANRFEHQSKLKDELNEFFAFFAKELLGEEDANALGLQITEADMDNELNAKQLKKVIDEQRKHYGRLDVYNGHSNFELSTEISTTARQQLLDRAYHLAFEKPFSKYSELERAELRALPKEIFKSYICDAAKVVDRANLMEQIKSHNRNLTLSVDKRVNPNRPTSAPPGSFPAATQAVPQKPK